MCPYSYYTAMRDSKDPRYLRLEMVRYDWSPRKDRVLLEYMDEHMAELAAILVKKNVIPEVPHPLPVMLERAQL